MKIVEIEATNRCNTNCFHCPREAMTRRRGMMSWEVFQPLADQILQLDDFDAVYFSGMGEPVLNPDLSRFVSYFSDHVPVSVTTNASLLTTDKIKALIQAQVDTILISFCGHDAELYGLMMGGLVFDKVNERIRELVRLGEGKVHIGSNVSVTWQTRPHLAQIRQHLWNLGVNEVIFAMCHNRGGYLVDPRVCNTPLPPVGEGRCDIFKSTCFVSWDGRVLACCHDLEGKGEVGDLDRQSLAEILVEKQRIVQQGVRFPMCQKCNDMYRFIDDPTPDGRPLSEWIYVLCGGDQEGTAKLKRVIRRQEAHIRGLEARIQGYEQGRVIRFLNWLRSIGRRREGR